jgi:hypothetical protein
LGSTEEVFEFPAHGLGKGCVGIDEFPSLVENELFSFLYNSNINIYKNNVSNNNNNYNNSKDINNNNNKTFKFDVKIFLNFKIFIEVVIIK